MKIKFLVILVLISFSLFGQGKSKVPRKALKKAKFHYTNCLDFLKESKLDLALEEIDNAISFNPNILEYYIAKVEIYFESGEFEKGMGTLNQSIDYFPENSEPYGFRASIFSILREYEAAISDFSKAILYAKNNEESATYYCNRGGAKSQIMQHEGAYEDLLMADSLMPNNLDVLNNLAMVCDEIGKPDETLVYLFKILTIDSMYVPAYVNIGYKYQIMEEYEKSIPYFLKAIELAPETALAYSNISYSLLKIGKLDEAMKHVNKSLELYPINPYAFRNRALIFLEKGEYTNACDDIDRGLDLGFAKSYGKELDELKNNHCIGIRN